MPSSRVVSPGPSRAWSLRQSRHRPSLRIPDPAEAGPQDDRPKKQGPVHPRGAREVSKLPGSPLLPRGKGAPRRPVYLPQNPAGTEIIFAARARSGGIMCFTPHDDPGDAPALLPTASSSARGESTTATTRPCLTTSTRPKAATSSSRPPKLFLALLAETCLGMI